MRPSLPPAPKMPHRHHQQHSRRSSGSNRPQNKRNGHTTSLDSKFEQYMKQKSCIPAFFHAIFDHSVLNTNTVSAAPPDLQHQLRVASHLASSSSGGIAQSQYATCGAPQKNTDGKGLLNRNRGDSEDINHLKSSKSVPLDRRTALNVGLISYENYAYHQHHDNDDDDDYMEPARVSFDSIPALHHRRHYSSCSVHEQGRMSVDGRVESFSQEYPSRRSLDIPTRRDDNHSQLDMPATKAKITIHSLLHSHASSLRSAMDCRSRAIEDMESSLKTLKRPQEFNNKNNNNNNSSSSSNKGKKDLPSQQCHINNGDGVDEMEVIGRRVSSFDYKEAIRLAANRAEMEALPRLSLDGRDEAISATKSVLQLRQAIRDRLMNGGEEQSSSKEMSSSQYSMNSSLHLKKSSCSIKPSVDSTMVPAKAAPADSVMVPGVVARLMGLDHIPTTIPAHAPAKSPERIPQKRIEMADHYPKAHPNSSKQIAKSMYKRTDSALQPFREEIEKRLQQIGLQNSVETEHKSIKRILEAMHVKGLLGSTRHQVQIAGVTTDPDVSKKLGRSSSKRAATRKSKCDGISAQEKEKMESKQSIASDIEDSLFPEMKRGISTSKNCVSDGIRQTCYEEGECRNFNCSENDLEEEEKLYAIGGELLNKDCSDSKPGQKLSKGRQLQERCDLTKNDLEPVNFLSNHHINSNDSSKMKSRGSQSKAESRSQLLCQNAGRARESMAAQDQNLSGEIINVKDSIVELGQSSPVSVLDAQTEDEICTPETITLYDGNDSQVNIHSTVTNQGDIKEHHFICNDKLVISDETECTNYKISRNANEHRCNTVWDDNAEFEYVKEVFKDSGLLMEDDEFIILREVQQSLLLHLLFCLQRLQLSGHSIDMDLYFKLEKRWGRNTEEDKELANNVKRWKLQALRRRFLFDSVDECLSKRLQLFQLWPGHQQTYYNCNYNYKEAKRLSRTLPCFLPSRRAKLLMEVWGDLQIKPPSSLAEKLEDSIQPILENELQPWSHVHSPQVSEIAQHVETFIFLHLLQDLSSDLLQW